MMNTITVNGKEYPLKEGSTISSVLAELGIKPEHKAIEQNGTIITAGSLSGTEVRPGDVIEIIQFVGGG